MRTLKFTLLISMLFLLTTSCTDLTEDIIPNDNDNHIELVNSIDTDSNIDDTGGTNNGSDGSGKDG